MSAFADIRIDPIRREDGDRPRWQAGKDIQLCTYTVSPDGMPMEIATTNTATNVTFRVMARRQGGRSGNVR